MTVRRLRQIALVAQDLAAVEPQLTEALGTEVVFRDPGVSEFGLHNALWLLGDTFLEVVSPTRDGTTAGRYLERRNGDGGYMVIVQSDDLDADRARVDDLGVRQVWKIDLADIRASHLHPADMGGAIVSIDHPVDPKSWRWGGPDWKANDAGEISAVEVQAEDPAKMAAHWSEALDRPARGNVIALDRGEIRFVPATDGRGDGVAAVEVTGSPAHASPETIEVAGIRLSFKPR